MDDDAKLKFLFYTIVLLAMMAVVGIWETVLEPLINLVTSMVNFA